MPQDVSGDVDLSFIVDGQQADASDVTIPFNDVIGVINDTLNGIQPFDQATAEQVEPNTDLGGDVGSITKRYVHMFNIVQANNIGNPLPKDTTNYEYYDEMTGTYPASFTQATAPTATSQLNPRGMWWIYSDPASTGWKYRFQTHHTLESGGDFRTKVFNIAPLNVGSANDFDWYFGLYRNNAGAIDEATYSRVHIQWDSAGVQHRIRGEASDGTTTYTGSWYTFPWLMYPIHIQAKIFNAANTPCYLYAGPYGDSHLSTLIYSVALGTTPTWGNLWSQYHLTKSAAGYATIYLGGHDFD